MSNRTVTAKQVNIMHPHNNTPTIWVDGKAPDLNDLRSWVVVGQLRHCRYCGSMHPADVAAAIKAGAKGSFADRKYGWPHKAYFEGIPNPHAGMLEVRSSSNTKQPGMEREFRSPQFDQHTGDRLEDFVRYTEEPQPASATTVGKFYTEHLQDATPEEREVIERHMGLFFTFHNDGKVSWVPIEAKT